MVPDPMKSVSQFALCVLFLVALSLPLVNFDNRLKLDPVPLLQEKRTLAESPALSVQPSTIGQFRSSFEAFYNDHFGFRNVLVRLNGLTKALVFLESPVDMVMIGTGGWLYYTGLGGAEDHRGLLPLTPVQLRTGQLFLEERRDRLLRAGAPVMLVIVPNKQTVYPEHLPWNANRVVGPTHLEQFLTYMHDHSDFPLVDLTDDLRAAKGTDPLYFKIDSHWNALGAWVGYRRIVAELARRYPTMRPTPLSELRIIGGPTCCDDLAVLAGLTGIFPPEAAADGRRSSSRVRSQDITASFDEVYSATLTQVDDASLPSAVVTCDSFCNVLLRSLLADHFRQAIFVHPKDLHYDPTPLVIRFQAEIVIQEAVERYLPYVVGIYQ